jgi:methylmalonyl-CoA mutase
MLKVDNAAVLAAQIDKLKRLRAERDQTATDAALEALTNGARGNANLLDLAVHTTIKATLLKLQAHLRQSPHMGK